MSNRIRPCLAISTALLTVSCGTQDSAETANISRAKPPIAQIDPGVFTHYKRDSWPKLFARWGDKGVARIQRLREAAALTAARNPKCDAVEISEISDSRSSFPNNPVVYVDCTNGERFYLDEDEVNGAISSETEKGALFSSRDLISKCTDAVRTRLNIPATFKQNMWSVSDRQGTSGNRVIEFDFEAKNFLGGQLPAKAMCIMTTQGQFEVTITQ